MEYAVKDSWHEEAKEQMRAIVDSLPEIEDKDKVSLDLLGDALDTFNKAIDGLDQTGLVITNQ